MTKINDLKVIVTVLNNNLTIAIELIKAGNNDAQLQPIIEDLKAMNTRLEQTLDNISSSSSSANSTNSTNSVPSSSSSSSSSSNNSSSSSNSFSTTPA